MTKLIQSLIQRKFFYDYLFYLALIIYVITAIFSRKFIYVPFGDRDLPSYLFEWKSLEYVLSQHRTIGLPLFLKLFTSNDISFRLWPYFQFGFMVLSILFLRYSLKYSFNCKALSCLLSILFLFMTYAERYNVVMSEPLAYASLNFSFASFLLVVTRSEKKDFLALLFTTFLAYQIRPALVVLPFAYIICLSYLLFLKKIKKKFFTKITLVLIAPLIIFLSLRLIVVNQFSLVAFTGSMLGGHALLYIDESTITKLPNANKEFAARLLDAKKKLLPSMTYGVDCKFLDKFDMTDFESILKRYNKEFDCWGNFNNLAWVHAINKLNNTWPLDDPKKNIDPWNHVYTLATYFSGNNVNIDKYLTNQSLAIIRAEIKNYLNWIWIACIYSPIAYLFSSARIYLSCFLIFLLWGIASLDIKSLFQINKNDRHLISNVFFIFSLSFFLLSLIPLIFIAAPLPRYLFAAFYFFYPAFIVYSFVKLHKPDTNKAIVKI